MPYIYMIDAETGDNIPVEVDDLVNSWTVVDYPHHKVHEGKYFSADYYDDNVANNGYVDILINASGILHTTMLVSVGGACTVNLYESPTDVTGGTDVTVISRNRNYSNPPKAVVKHSPTVNDAGSTVLGTRYIPGGNNVQTRIGGEARNGTELIFKTGESYLLRVQNLSGGVIIINTNVEYYY